MPRQPSAVPSYLHHKPSGQAYVRLRTPDGGRKDVYLGIFNSPASRAEYARIVAELQAAHGRPPAVAGPSVNEVLVAFLRHAERHYVRPDGTHTDEVKEYKLVARPLRDLYGHTPAAEFGPLALKAVRDRLVAQGLCRKLVNQRVGRVKRVFKWAASEQLVPVAVPLALATVAGFQAGRSGVRESPAVGTVEP